MDKSIDCCSVSMNGKSYDTISAAIDEGRPEDTIYVSGSPMEYYATHPQCVPNELPKPIIVSAK